MRNFAIQSHDHNFNKLTNLLTYSNHGPGLILSSSSASCHPPFRILRWGPLVHLRLLSDASISVIPTWYRLEEPVMEIVYWQKTVFTRSAITPPKVNRFWWNLEHCEHIVGGWPW